MRSDAGEFGVAEVAGFGEFADADGAAAGVELDGVCRSVSESDGLRLEPAALFFAPSVFAARLLLDVGLGRSDSVDRQQTEFTQQGLVALRK